MGIFDRPRAPHGCFVCGEKATMSVVVTAGKLGQERTTTARIARSRSYCDEHGELMFKKLLGHPQFEREL